MKPSIGAVRAANAISHLPGLSAAYTVSLRDACARIIESETHLGELIEALEPFAMLFDELYFHKGSLNDVVLRFVYGDGDTAVIRAIDIKMVRDAIKTAKGE